MTRIITIAVPAVIALPIAAWVIGSCTVIWLALYAGHQLRRVLGLVR